VFWGTLDDVALLGEFREEIDWHVTGYLDKEDYEAGFILSDIVINLRFPSSGEFSATLCEAMKYRKPVIVSDVNQYTEFPDEVCWKVCPGDDEVNLMVRYISYLIDNKDVLNALADNAGNYADKVLSPQRIAKLYYNVLHKEST
jgi:glycosyltransferase involved in cell wall biosynthesis